MFVGRGFSRDVMALVSSGVLTPEGFNCTFSAACKTHATEKRYDELLIACIPLSGNISTVKPAIRVAESLHAFRGRPAFLQVSSRNLWLDHPLSAATCGNNTALRPSRDTTNPCRPATTDSGAIGCNADNTESSIFRVLISFATTGGNRGSCNAALIAARDTTSANGPKSSTCPMHPRSFPPR